MGLLTLVEIVAVTLATAIVAEGIQLYVVYRSEGYLRDKGMLEKTVKLSEKRGSEKNQKKIRNC